jgi:hypothetical protein
MESSRTIDKLYLPVLTLPVHMALLMPYALLMPNTNLVTKLSSE